MEEVQKYYPYAECKIAENKLHLLLGSSVSEKSLDLSAVSGKILNNEQ